jgi:hypothetical protein
MSDWKEKLLLADDQKLKHTGSATKGFMGETDVDTYDVIDQNNLVVGTVTVEDHTAVKGFKRTISVVQRSSDGTVLVQEAWTA